MKPKITSSKYTELSGLKCPTCESKDIEGGPVEIDCGTAWQHITCNECGSGWTDLYKLVGYTELTWKKEGA